MSGPKVVRVVTREERVSICVGLLARLRAALDEWERVGRRNNTITDHDVNQMHARYQEFEKALAADRFDNLQRKIPADITFVQQDQEKRLADAIDREVRARRSERRKGRVAAEVLAALERSDVVVPSSLRDALMRGAAGDSESETAIRQGMALLRPPDEMEVTKDQKALAERLKDGNDRQTFADWLSNHEGSVGTEESKIERQLAELSGVLGPGAEAAFAKKLGEALNETLASRRALLMDSLIVEAAQAVRDARRRVLLQARLRAIAAEFQQLGNDGGRQRSADILSAVEGTTDVLTRVEEQATTDLDGIRARAAASARRAAVLKGLAALGYQVTEDLETAWVQAGHVVVKRATQPGYGVELAGNPDAGRLQVRVVAFRSATTNPDRVRDEDAERLWCADLVNLQKSISAAGGGLAVERSLAIGAAPLKTVDDVEADSAGRRGRADIGKRERPGP